MEIHFSILRKIICWTFHSIAHCWINQIKTSDWRPAGHVCSPEALLGTALRPAGGRPLPWKDFCGHCRLAETLGVQVTWGALSSPQGAWTIGFWARMLCCHRGEKLNACLQTSPSSGNQNPPHPVNEDPPQPPPPRRNMHTHTPFRPCSQHRFCTVETKSWKGNWDPCRPPTVSWSPPEDGEEGETGMGFGYKQTSR